jgi:hypothetical protein
MAMRASRHEIAIRGGMASLPRIMLRRREKATYTGINKLRD